MMFASRKELKHSIENLQYQISNVAVRYWDLQQKHDLLLRHFGLTEYTTPEKTELRTNGGPKLGA